MDRFTGYRRCRPGAEKDWAVRVIRDQLGLHVSGAKDMVDVVLKGGLVTLEARSDAHARELAAKLKNLNFDAFVE